MLGLDLGQLLCMAGQREQGSAFLTRSREGFPKLGPAPPPWVSLRKGRAPFA